MNIYDVELHLYNFVYLDKDRKLYVQRHFISLYRLENTSSEFSKEIIVFVDLQYIVLHLKDFGVFTEWFSRTFECRSVGNGFSMGDELCHMSEIAWGLCFIPY